MRQSSQRGVLVCVAAVALVTVSILLSGSVVASGGRWTALASMPGPRTNSGSAVFNGLVYEFGGSSGGGCAFPSHSYAYDPVAKTWTAKAAPPVQSSGTVAGAIGGFIYTAGGQVDPCATQAFTPTQRYDPSTDSWISSLAQPPFDTVGPVGVALNGKLYLLGGSQASGAPVLMGQAYDPGTDSWAALAPVPQASTGAAVAAVGNVIYVVGGTIDCLHPALTTVRAFDTVSGTWSIKAPLPTGVAGASAAAVNGRLYVIGGALGCLPPIDPGPVQVYDPSADIWSSGTAMPSGASSVSQAAAATGGVGYVVGGNQSGAVLSTAWAFTPGTAPTPTPTPTDTTPPVIAVTATAGGAPYASGSWTNRPVTVSWNVADPESGVASSEGCGPATLSAETAGTTLTCRATNGVGLSATASFTVRIDTTPPEVVSAFDPATLDLAVSGRDALSGAASVVLASSAPAPAGDQHGGGSERAARRTYVVTDRAGNVTTIVEDVQKHGHEVHASAVSIRYGSGPSNTFTTNHMRFEWALTKSGSLQELDQQIEVGGDAERDHDAESAGQEVHATFRAGKGITVTVEEPMPKVRTNSPDLVLLRLVTAGSGLTIEH